MSEGFVKAIAIDYDGCIAINSWPGVGEPNWPVINRAKEERAKGAKLILWTCREGHKLEEALDACWKWGLRFDSVNESLPEWIEDWGCRPRKIGATEYWDDRAVRMPAGHLVDIPCKIGDTMWGIARYNGHATRVRQGAVTEMYYGEDMRLCIVMKGVCRGEYGKDVFHTREAAEAAMREEAK